MFGYIELLKELEELSKYLRIEIIGKSEFGRSIFGLHRGNKKALIQGGIHAREHITAKLTLELAKNYSGGDICFVPLTNPDGAELCIRGIKTAPKEYRDFLLSVNSNNKDFSLWKANGRAVDINVNFDADWGMGIANKQYPFASDYVGKFAFSESETRALRDYTLANKFLITVSYHSKGEVIYYGYGNNKNGESFVRSVADMTGYSIEQIIGSAGGYKDWFCSAFDNIGLTIEVGRDKYEHPFPYSEFSDIIKKNNNITGLIEKELANG